LIGLIGKLLLALAFLAAAAEAYVHILPGGPTALLVPMAELWAILSPDSLRASTDWLWDSLQPWVWDPLLAGILKLPLWLALGLPGVLLVWWGRRPDEGEIAADLQAESVFLYDELAKAAKEEARNPTLLDDEFFEAEEQQRKEPQRKENGEQHGRT